MEIFFSFFLEIFLKSACRKLTAILEQNCKRNVDQHASEIMWLYGLRKKFFGRCLLLEWHIQVPKSINRSYWQEKFLFNFAGIICVRELLIMKVYNFKSN